MYFPNIHDAHYGAAFALACLFAGEGLRRMPNMGRDAILVRTANVYGARKARQMANGALEGRLPQ